MTQIHWTATGVVVAAIFLAPAATADDQSFLADLASKGITNYYGNGPDHLLYMGHQACDQMHQGASGETVIGYFGPLQRGFGESFLASVQSQLCPDTLGR